LSNELDPVIVFDIEATHLKSNFGHVLCIGFKTLGGKTKILSIRDYALFKSRPWDDSRLLEDVFDVLSTAGMWVTYYGSRGRFDLPFLQSRMIKAGIGIMPPVRMVDMYDTAKSWLPLHSRRLGSVGQFLGTKAEKTVLDPEIWERAQYGSVKDIKYIERHCVADVDLLEEVYIKLRGLIRTHPTRTILPEGVGCTNCGSVKLRRQGIVPLRGGYERHNFSCKECGAWGSNRRVAA
jgi:uncharacterized protein YprB with RNaseH-like and TPR domain